MDVVVYALCKKLIADSISSIGNVFTLQGTLLSENDLPMSGNKSGDLYLVGPMSDGSFDEYYWRDPGVWEFMGSTVSNVSGYISKNTLYAGDNNTGTIENPAEGTILAIVNSQNRINFLSKDNIDEYIPINDYNPATKKYVDDLDKNNVKYINDDNVEFKNHIVIPFGSNIFGNSPDNGWSNLASVKGYNLNSENEIIQSELGSTTLHTTINSKDRPSIDTENRQEELAYLSDLEELNIDKEILFIQIPIKTLQDKIYSQEEIFNWFNVKDIIELKEKISGNYLPILKYGISLSTMPHYYKMLVEYLAFESKNQIKLVFSGLNISNDDVSKYEIIINLDGTIIENNSNIKLNQLQIIDEEKLRTELENMNKLEII